MIITKRKMLIILPFPDPRLSPNKRLCWKAKLKLKPEQRQIGFNASRLYLGKIGKNNVHIKITFMPPDKKHRDIDNLLSSLKHAIDGVAQGLGINDKQFRPITLDMGEPDKANPRTELEIL